MARRSRSLTGVVALALGSYLASLGSAMAVAQGQPTVWDGAYTDAQAARAVGTFSANCAECHTLGGTGDGQLVGTPFWEGYSQKTISDLVTFVRTNMPSGAEGSLSPSTYNDLVALILKSNGLPAGGTELSPETVGHLRIMPKDGSTALPANTLARVVGCLARSGSEWVLTNATPPERIDRAGVGEQDATRALGTATVKLKFVLNRLDAFVGQRMSASGLLLGTAGVDGLNVSNVSRVAQTCP
jgi:mono/diheme cytochrome c family protein